MTAAARGVASGATGSSTRVLLSEEELERVMKEFSKEDEVGTKTLSRRFVEKFLMHRKWYNPQRDSTDPDKPNLAQGWAFYEHVTLPRRFVTDQTAEATFERAEPGEGDHATELFSPLKTPERALNEFGIGIAMYFASLRIMAIVVAIAGIISLPNILYYRSEAYNGEGGQSQLSFPSSGIDDLHRSRVGGMPGRLRSRYLERWIKQRSMGRECGWHDLCSEDVVCWS